MSSTATVSFASALISVLLGSAVILRGKPSAANRLFFAGMLCLAFNGLFDGLSQSKESITALVHWQRWSLFSKAFLPGIWLTFSLVYSRGNYREFLSRWRPALMLAFLLPLVLVVAGSDDLIRSVQVSDAQIPLSIGCGAAGIALHALILLSSIIVLANLEKTFRTTVGTMRWRIKFVVLGLSVIFGAMIYTASQAMLYSAVLPSHVAVEATGTLIGCVLVGISYVRAGRTEIDVYPSHAFLYNSLTVILAGIYLLSVGLLAKLAEALGGDTAFPIKALLVLIGIVGLALVLMSDRIRQRSRHFISRHLQRPLYDYRSVWRSFTESTTSRVEQADLCNVVVRFTSDLFQVLSVTLWLIDREQGRLTFAASTSQQPEESAKVIPDTTETSELTRALEPQHDAINIDNLSEKWAATLRKLTPGEFRSGGNRVCIPIRAGGELLGILTLGDRVSGVPWSTQDTDLLKCIADQAAACLRNIQLSQRLVQSKELEAFQTMSAFFVHDLKNTASTLSLMLKNLPVHFDDPGFREDALRGISNTVTHINSLIGRLSMLRQQLAIVPAECDLNALVEHTLKSVGDGSAPAFVTQFAPLPKLQIDAEQMQKVILNLALNAREAVGPDGQIRVETGEQDGWAVISVADNGCGMTPEFIQRSLFRPFQTTKKRGIGIGMFQSRMIVEAHKGRIEVQSAPGQGTTFRVLLPKG